MVLQACTEKSCPDKLRIDMKREPSDTRSVIRPSVDRSPLTVYYSLRTVRSSLAANPLHFAICYLLFLLRQSSMLNDIRIIVHTAKGDLEATLIPADAPVATANFLNLARRKFYDGLIFHRVVPAFVIQGGDPAGTGRGDPGYRFENEPRKSLSHETVGVLAMANAGPNTNGSQFYVTLAPLNPTHVKMLDEGYTIFGRLTEGIEIANQIAQGDKITSITILDPVEPLFQNQKERLQEWNQVLDRKFGSRLAPSTT
jgi:peptidyl-prolyl cis-trans isomerase B (cyclophilin B)